MSLPTALPINANRVRGVWVLTGGTFNYKESLKSRGCRWNPEHKAWTYDAVDLPPFVRDLIKDSGGMIAGENSSAPAPTAPAAPPQIQIVEKIVEVPTDKIVEIEKIVEVEKIKMRSRGTHIRINHLRKYHAPVKPVTESFVKPGWWDRICYYLKKGRPAIAVVGPAGNGKTTTAKAALNALNIEYEYILCTDRTEVLDLTGGTILKAEGEVWVEGIVTKAFREGKAVILDEADSLDPRVFMCLQNATQDAGPSGKDRHIATPNGIVYPAASCPIILCMNTTGSGATRQYAGRNKLDAASLDRLTVISTKYENEVQILGARNVAKRTAEKVVEWAERIRKKIDDAGLPLVLSPRTLLRICEVIEDDFMTFEEAIEAEFIGRLDEHVRQHVAEQPQTSGRRFGNAF